MTIPEHNKPYAEIEGLTAHFFSTFRRKERMMFVQIEKRIFQRASKMGSLYLDFCAARLHGQAARIFCKESPVTVGAIPPWLPKRTMHEGGQPRGDCPYGDENNSHRFQQRLPRRFAPRNDVIGLGGTDSRKSRYRLLIFLARFFVKQVTPCLNTKRSLDSNLIRKMSSQSLNFLAYAVVLCLLSFNAMAQPEPQVTKEEVIKAIEKTLEIAEKEFENGSFKSTEEWWNDSENGYMSCTSVFTWNGDKFRTEFETRGFYATFSDGKFYYAFVDSMRYKKWSSRLERRDSEKLPYMSTLKTMLYWWGKFPETPLVLIPGDKNPEEQTINLTFNTHYEEETYCLLTKYPYHLIKITSVRKGRHDFVSLFYGHLQVCEGVYLPTTIVESGWDKEHIRTTVYEEFKPNIKLPDSFFQPPVGAEILEPPFPDDFVYKDGKGLYKDLTQILKGDF